MRWEKTQVVCKPFCCPNTVDMAKGGCWAGQTGCPGLMEALPGAVMAPGRWDLALTCGLNKIRFARFSPLKFPGCSAGHRF